jgi:GDPmannose 4,6-dehydratase
MKTAIITGVTGQSGSYLSELLLDKNYEVIGVKRRSSTNTTKNIEQILDHPNFHLVEGDIIDAHSVSGLISKYKPDEFFNLAAMSHVGESFKQPTYTFMADAVGPLNILEAVRTINPTTKVYQASTSELFASNYSTDPTTLEKYQDEDTPLGANSPYAAA